MHESRDRAQVLPQIIHEPIDSKGVKPLFYRVGGGGSTVFALMVTPEGK